VALDDEPLVTARDEPAAQLWQPPPPGAAAAPPAVPAPGYEPLPNSYGRPRRRPFPLGLLLLAILLLGGGAAFLLGPAALRAQVSKVTRREQAVLIVTSEPPGAQVRIGGQLVGQTPLSQENLYAPGAELQVQVTLRGYRPWTGKLRGGESVTLEASLRR